MRWLDGITNSMDMSLSKLKPWTFLVAQSLPAMWETQVRALGLEDPLEKEMATHPSTLA